MAKKIISARMQQRQDTRAAWEAANPVLLDGELGLVSDDQGLYKMGDGVTPWNGLPYRGFDGSIVQEPGSSTRSVMSQAAVTAQLSELGRQLEGKAGKTDLAEVAKTGSYEDLKDRPELAKVAGSGDYQDLENRPTFATVNGQRIDQGGEIHIEAGGPEIVVDSVLSEDSTNPVQNQAVAKAVAGKQDLLMNGINIKTINGENILGRGNITIEGGGETEPAPEEVYIGSATPPSSAKVWIDPTGTPSQPSQPSAGVEVIDNLESDSTTAALSANQGRVLKEMIENVPSGGGGGNGAKVYIVPEGVMKTTSDNPSYKLSDEEVQDFLSHGDFFSSIVWIPYESGGYTQVERIFTSELGGYKLQGFAGNMYKYASKNAIVLDSMTITHYMIHIGEVGGAYYGGIEKFTGQITF